VTVPKSPPFNQPFQVQLDFFRQKLNLPTEAWDDITLAAHDRAFMVAGAQGSDLLADLNQAVDDAIANGTGLDQFRKEFAQIVAEHGWTGWTGEGTPGGVAWRTKVIYQTNMATSYAAGRYKQLSDPDLLKLLPYWQYHHNDSVVHPRPLHVSWDGLTLPPDHPFWTTHFPPNGWGCQCWVSAVSKDDFMVAIANGKGPANAPTGTEGIDEGFAYAPGANADTSLREIVQDKLITYPPAITKALTRDVNRYINAEQGAAVFAREVLADASRNDPLWLGFVDNFEEVGAAAGTEVKGYMVVLPPDAVRHAEISHGSDGGAQRAATPEDYNLILQVLTEAGSLRAGEVSARGLSRIVVVTKIGAEIFRCVFEVRTGKRNMALALISLVIKQ
jgi:hypothetical protein